MGFIRAKKINGKEYAYLVENKWYKRRFKSKGRGPRQRVAKYLGKIYSFNKENNVEFFNFKKINDLEQYLKNKDKKNIIKDLIEWELFRHKIDNNVFSIDLINKKIMKKKKDVSLKLNEGFLNSYTLNRLFNLKSNDSHYLAKCFVEAGVEVPKEVFVGMFSE